MCVSQMMNGRRFLLIDVAKRYFNASTANLKGTKLSETRTHITALRYRCPLVPKAFRASCRDAIDCEGEGRFSCLFLEELFRRQIKERCPNAFTRDDLQDINE
ncbi:hypothetical protein RF11_05942 [Thelohanellus kitauei]|uniref:Uncharacterized protein n=1 Tax=Thelohanellus kitauei TaxID=669202 RepID=A0A0C2MR85_THEKT|nr:hypothetical protein RF11_05942 [Thelohanellus kitauei]